MSACPPREAQKQTLLEVREGPNSEVRPSGCRVCFTPANGIGQIVYQGILSLEPPRIQRPVVLRESECTLATDTP